VDIGTAIKRPFTNITNLIIGLIVMIIPIINILVLPGYLLRVAKTAMTGDDKLPGFSDIGGLVVSSIKAIVVGVIYLIILTIIMSILALIPVIGGILALIAYIIAIFVILAGFMTLADTGSIGDALAFKALFGKAKKGDFIIAVIVGYIIMAIVVGIIGLGAIIATAGPVAMGLLTGVLDATTIITMVGAGMLGFAVLIIVAYIMEIFFITVVAKAYK